MQYARWAEEKEIKERLYSIKPNEEIKRTGVPLMYENDTLYMDNGRTPTLLIGSTGSGKTQSTILPMLNLSIKAKESFLVVDPKGEMYERIGKKVQEEGYKTVILNFENTSLGNNWNPLLLPYQIYKEGNKDRAQEMVEEVAYYLFSEEMNKEQDPFWLNSTIDYFTGLVLYLFTTKTEKEISLTNVALLSQKLNMDEERQNFLKELRQYPTIYFYLTTTLEAPNETRGSIVAVFNQKIKPFISKENLSNLLSATDIDFKDIVNNKSAVFLIASLTEISKRLIPLYINQVIESKEVYQNKEPYNMLLDEFGCMIKMQNFAAALTNVRGLNIQIIAVVQNYKQLESVYGKEDSEILKLCFSNILYLLSNDIYSLEEISKMCGEVSKDVPLITIEELKTMKHFEAIVIMPRLHPFKTKLQPNYKFDWGYQEEAIEIPKRKIVEQTYID